MASLLEERAVRTLAAALLLLAACSSDPPAPPAAPLAGQPMGPSQLRGFDPAATSVGARVLIAGQPTPEGLANARDAGVKLVINLRPDYEQGFDEGAIVQGLGMAYVSVPITEKGLTDQKVASFIDAVRAAKEAPGGTDRLLVHCQSGNRAAALWAMYEIADGKMNPEEAVARARKAGLKSPELVGFIGDWARRTGAW
jgi:uncharacterized protein (TIGR01244 family)